MAVLLLYVHSRTSHTEKLIRSPFRGRSRSDGLRAPGGLEPDEVRVSRISAADTASAEPQSELGEATYNCGCGYVFQAPVLTSVDCPHCGDSQAW